MAKPIPLTMVCQRCGHEFRPVLHPQQPDLSMTRRVDCPQCDLVHLMTPRRWYSGDFPQRVYPSQDVSPTPPSSPSPSPRAEGQGNATPQS